MRHFLNEDMRRFQNISDNDASDLRNAFKKSTQIIHTLLGHNAFKRFYRGDANNPNGSWEAKRFNYSLYDILMYGFTDFEKHQIHPHLDSIREALIGLMTNDQDFIDSIELSTSSRKMVTIRFDKWRKTMEQTIGTPINEPRTFSRKLKVEMFDLDTTCAICGQQITNVDDAALDHIEQYWQGGKTVPENARLAHRYCNWSRPRKEKSTKS